MRDGVPAVATVMSMAVAPFLPRDMPLVVGTEQIADHERARRPARGRVIEPPVDVRRNAPGAVDTDAFRREHALDPDALTVVVRQPPGRRAQARGTAGGDRGRGPARTAIQLVIVGDGPSRAEVEAAAERANAAAARRAVVLTGELRDPRPAYAAADVVARHGRLRAARDGVRAGR